MLRTLLLTAALGALALPAAAATYVKVNVSGLDAKAAHVAIVHAATEACQIELRGVSDLERYYGHVDCIKSAVARAETGLSTQAERTADNSPRAGGH